MSLKRMSKAQRAKAKEPLKLTPNTMATFPIVLTTFVPTFFDCRRGLVG